jgi:hypothetical protein
MSIAAAGLLKLLGSAVSGGSKGLPPDQVEGAEFSKLLEKAQAGEVASGREVSIAKGANVSLSPDQLARIAVAADMAEAKGASSALVMIDGMTLRLDVAMREITGAADLSRGGVLTGIDTVIGIPGSADQGAKVLPLPKGAANPSLLKILAETEKPRPAA